MDLKWGTSLGNITAISRKQCLIDYTCCQQSTSSWLNGLKATGRSITVGHFFSVPHPLGNITAISKYQTINLKYSFPDVNCLYSSVG